MEPGFSDIIVKLVHQAEPDLDARLEAQDEELLRLKCTNPVLGKWIDAYDVEYLLAAFALNDADFSEDFPKLAHLKQSEREKVVKAFEDHFDHCPHCHLKRGYDLELNSRIELACRQTKDHVTHQKKQDDCITSGKADESPKLLMFRAYK